MSRRPRAVRRRGIGVWVASLALVSASPIRVGAQPPSAPYPILIRPGFQSAISADQAADLALEAVTVPVAVVPSGRFHVPTFEPPLPRILEMIGCRGADLPRIDSRVSAAPDPSVWYVHLRGTFVMPHLGRMTDQDGYVLIDVRSGLVFRRGVFLTPGRSGRDDP